MVQYMLMKVVMSSHIKRHLASLLSSHLGLPSYISKTHIAFFLFYLIISSDVAFELPIKQLQGSGVQDGAWGMYVLFNFYFSLSNRKKRSKHSSRVFWGDCLCFPA